MARALVKYPASAAGIGCLIVLTLFFWHSGALWPSVLPEGVHSRRQIIGMALMLILAPSYLLFAVIVAMRRSLELVEQLKPMLPDPDDARDAERAIREGFKRTWHIGTATGLFLGLNNTQPIYAFTESSTPTIDGSISIGQLILWLIIGLALWQRIVAARAFSRLGEVVSIDLFRLDRLRPLALSGMVDVLIIAGALSLSPLQSLDAEFRWYNYSFALLVSVPAGLVLLMWPLRAVHRRIQSEKQSYLERVDGLLQETSREATSDDVQRLESLLAHRERIRNESAWPLDTGLLSRLFAYLIIPPLAWVGGALVEMLVDRIVGS